jgi:hypothetical protein
MPEINTFPSGEAGTRGETFPDDNAEDLGVLFAGRKRIVRQNPALDAQKSTHRSLFDMRILLLEVVRKTETNDRQTREIAFWIVFMKCLFSRLDPMDLRKTDIVYMSGYTLGLGGIQPVNSRALERNLAFVRERFWILEYPSIPR